MSDRTGRVVQVVIGSLVLVFGLALTGVSITATALALVDETPGPAYSRWTLVLFGGFCVWLGFYLLKAPRSADRG